MRPRRWGPRKRSCCESARWNHPSHRGSGEVGRAACGNDGALESLENQRQVFHPSQRSLEISQRRRDFHIPTGTAVSPHLQTKNSGLWKSGNPKAGFPLSHSPGSLRRKEQDHLKTTPKGMERISCPVSANYLFHAHLVLEWKSISCSSLDWKMLYDQVMFLGYSKEG